MPDREHIAQARGLVFCANSGRAGSRYLAALIDSSNEAVACHEPEPKMIDAFLTLVNRHDYAFSYAQRNVKCAAIEAALAALSPPKTVYGETSHMFIKTYYDVVLDAFPRAKVIVLRRPLAETLRSFVELGYFSPANANWPKWMSSPNATTAALPAVAPDASLDQVDLCIAYLLDIEARVQRMRSQYPDVATMHIALDDLNSPPKVDRVFAWLGITRSAQTAEVEGERLNAKDKRKSKLRRLVTTDWCQDRIDRYVARARQEWQDRPTLEKLEAVLRGLAAAHS
jgi:hypothetical protein